MLRASPDPRTARKNHRAPLRGTHGANGVGAKGRCKTRGSTSRVIMSMAPTMAKREMRRCGTPESLTARVCSIL